MQDDQNQPSYVDDYTPPSDQQANSTSGDMGANTQTVTSQSIEDQNIFVLLGVDDGTDEQKEQFLDELQQVIWEDFIENDVELLLTEEELAEVKKLFADSAEKQEEEKQEAIVDYLEKLIPDLEEIMLEKALELKENMVRERATGLKQFFAGKQEQLDQMEQVERLFSENKWADAATLMNKLVE